MSCESPRLDPNWSDPNERAADLRRYRLASYFNGYQQRLCGQQDSAAVFCEWPRVDTVVDEQINLTRLVVGATNHFATNSFEAARQAALKKATDTVLSHTPPTSPDYF